MLNDKKIQDHIAEFQNNKKLNQIMQSEDNLNEQNFQIYSKSSKIQQQKPIFDPLNNETVKLEGIKGFEEFKKAIRQLGGEEAP
jgi:hypothetical protein